MGFARVIALFGIACSAGCSLVLDFSETPDAAPTVNPLCDAFEPNDDDGVATAATPGTPQSAALCGDDVDLFRLDVVEFDDVTITAAAMVGLNLELELSAAGLTIDSSDGPGDELIERTADMGNQLAAGSYIISVTPSSQAVGEKDGDYQLSITVTNNPPLIDAGMVDAI